MSDTILREDIKNAITATLAESIECEHSAIEALNLLRHEIMALPSAEKTGKWVLNDNSTFSCSLCQSWIPKEQHYYARFCLYCGAEMER